MTKIQLENIRHCFPLPGKKTLTAVEGVNLTLRQGEFVAILGESGCGKSTLLNLVAGLLQPTSGRVLVNGAPVTEPHHSRMMMFQQPCLLPWLTVVENIAFGCRLRGECDTLGARVTEFVRIMGLEGFEHVYPSALSAGMLQRTALARSLIGKPEILLMDEAFSDVDFFTRHRLLKLVLDLWKQLGLTIILVTHDIDEALLLAQRMVVMGDRPGAIKQVIDIEFPYPRDIRDPGMSGKKNDILDQFKDLANIPEPPDVQPHCNPNPHARTAAPPPE